MKLNDILNEVFDASKERQTVQNARPVGATGDLINAAQAARILDVSPSRIRQMVADKDNPLPSVPPAEGQRDHLFKISDVKAYKKKHVGRPEKNNK